MDLGPCLCVSSSSPDGHEQVTLSLTCPNPSESGQSSTMKNHVVFGKASAPTRYRLELLSQTSRITPSSSLGKAFMAPTFRQPLGKLLAFSAFSESLEILCHDGVAFGTPVVKDHFVSNPNKGVASRHLSVKDHLISNSKRGVVFRPLSVKDLFIFKGVHFQPPTVKDHIISKPQKGISFFVNNRSLVFPKDSDHG